MAIGLIRTSDEKMYLIWGILLLFGAVMSFLVTGLGRHRLAAGRPEQYLGIWQAKAEGRRSNPILYFGRYTEFIIRRCFMPYALLFFAVFNHDEGCLLFGGDWRQSGLVDLPLLVLRLCVYQKVSDE